MPEIQRLLVTALLQWALLLTSVLSLLLSLRSEQAIPQVTGWRLPLAAVALPTLLGSLGLLLLVVPLLMLCTTIRMLSLAPRLRLPLLDHRILRDATLMVTIHWGALLLLAATYGRVPSLALGLISAAALATAWANFLWTRPRTGV